MEFYIALVALGVIVGALGTLIGAGGGFVLVPILLLLDPNEQPETIASLSLAVVFFNALSGSVSYARMRRIDYRSGLLFASATVPGAVLGALTTGIIPRRGFDAVFGILMIAAATFLILHPVERDPAAVPGKGNTTRTVVERNGTAHTFSFDARVGVVLSVFVGYVSSLLGIGGGIIHVPVLVHLLNFPVHIATATSHFILAIMALTGTIVHIVSGSFSETSVYWTLALGAGVLAGAPLGARLSARLRGMWIIRGLAIALGFVGVRILLMAFSL